MSDKEQHLFETSDTGPLDTRGYEAASFKDTTRPSLSEDYTGPGAGNPELKASKGIGGTVAGIEHSKPVQAQPRAMTPEEMMAMADAQIADYHRNTLAAHDEHMSAVEPTLSRPGPYNHVPDWLTQYMETQPNAGTSMVDRLGTQKYKYESDYLKKLKADRSK